MTDRHLSDDRPQTTCERACSRRSVLTSAAVAAVSGLAGCGYQPGGGELVWNDPQRIASSAEVVASDGAVFAARNVSGMRMDWDAEEWIDAEETVVTRYTPDGSASTIRFEPQFRGEPVAVGDRVYVPAIDGGIAAAAFGREEDPKRWLVEQPSPVRSIDIGDGYVFCADENEAVHCLDDDTGEQQWVHSVDETPSIAATDDVFTCLTIDGEEIRCRRFDPADGTELWTATRSVPDANAVSMPDPIVTDRSIIVSVPGAESVYAIAVGDGSIRWEKPVETGRNRPIIGGNRIYLHSEDGLAAHDLESGEQYWTLGDGYDSITSTVADENGIYRYGNVPDRSGLRLYSISPEGDRRWDAPLPDDLDQVDGLFLIDDVLVVRAGDRLHGMRSAPGNRLSVLQNRR